MLVRSGLSIAVVLGVLHVAVKAYQGDIQAPDFVSGSTGVKLVGADNVGNHGLGFDSFTYMTGIGDFSGDQIDDFVICGGYMNVRGNCYFIMGKTTPYSADYDLAGFTEGTDGFRAMGGAFYDYLGTAVAAAGDFNNDGYDDVIVTAAQFPGAYHGKVYMFFGHAGPYSNIDLGYQFTSSLGFHITGAVGGAASSAEHFGSAIAGGNFNNDEYSDIVICAATSDLSGRTAAGACLVLMGRAGVATSFSNLNMGDVYMSGSSEEGFMIFGAEAGDQLGAPYAGASMDCDLNGDGFDDVMLAAAGAHIGSTYGAVFVIFGRATGAGFSAIDLNGFTSSTSTGFKLTGTTDSSVRFGYMVSSAGDFNNDGFGDMMVSAPFAPFASTSQTGLVWVIFGSASLGTDIECTDAFTSGIAGFLLHGADHSSIGIIARSAGDVNGDGIDDIIIGAPYAFTNGLTENGYAQVLYGHSNDTSFPTIDTSTFTTGPTTGFKMFGVINQKNMGYYVSGAGDVNGDGVDDLMIGSTETASSGQPVYLLYGQAPPPTAVPTPVPTAPSVLPTVLPSAAPTFDPALLQKLLTSPTHMVKNGFAFAALDSTGHVHTWGELQHGGMSAPVQGLLQDVTSLIPSRFSFGALTADDIFLTWGVNMMYLPSGSHSMVVANEAAYAAIRISDSGVTAVGSKHNGGNVQGSGYSAQLSSGVQSITASAGAFAALKTDGTVYTWGNHHSGAGVSTETMPELAGVTKVVATRDAFAALLFTGRVYTWGGKSGGGDSSAVAGQLMSGVVNVIAAKDVFIAMKADLRIVVWGYGPFGGDTSAVASALAGGVQYVAHTFMAMAAIRPYGTVVAWGDATGGGDCSAVQSELHNVVHIYGSSKSFAALRGDGSVVTWGRAAYGGQIPSNKANALSSGVLSIYSTDRAFAALKADGAVVVWGQAGHGGSPGAAVEAHLASGVHTICSNDVAFSVIKTDGSVVGWGHEVSVPTAGVLFTSAELYGNVTCA